MRGCARDGRPSERAAGHPAAVVAAIVVVAWLASAGSAAAGERFGACPTGGKRILASNGVIVVYREPLSRHGGGESYACARRTGNLVTLDEPPVSGAFPPPALALAGYKVAYGEEILTNDNEAATRVRVIDARKPDIEAQQQGRRADTLAKIGSMVLSPSGSVAWISCDLEQEGNGRIPPACARPGAPDRVYRFRSTRSRHELLARGRNIDPSSLRRKGGRISWIAGGRRRTASLDG